MSLPSTLFTLDGQTAVVTGASRGLGRGIALALASAGADIVAVSRHPAEALAADVSRLAHRCHIVTADLRDPAQVEEVIPRAVAVAGRLDILVNNAGTTARGPAMDVAPEDWHDVLQVNLHATFRLCQAAAKAMLPRGRGKIVNIASLMSFQGGINISPYTASKGAVGQLTKALATEWAPLGINVNAIVPGYIATDMTRVLREDSARNTAILARIPAGRWARPEDFAGAVIFLAAPASDYVHGHLLVVDGGWLAR
jgi:2-deoxy-D-gluconate 3-dehydrogenase